MEQNDNGRNLRDVAIVALLITLPIIVLLAVLP